GDFEGIIPEGQYGGGTVLLWDRGAGGPLENPHEGLRQGSMKFELPRAKLPGKGGLGRVKGRDARGEGRAWLLIKERDDQVRSNKVYDVTQDRAESVSTGRTLEQIAADRDRVWNSNREERGEVRGPAARAARVARTKTSPAAPSRAPAAAGR